MGFSYYFSKKGKTGDLRMYGLFQHKQFQKTCIITEILVAVRKKHFFVKTRIKFSSMWFFNLQC